MIARRGKMHSHVCARVLDVRTQLRTVKMVHGACCSFNLVSSIVVLFHKLLGVALARVLKSKKKILTKMLFGRTSRPSRGGRVFILRGAVSNRRPVGGRGIVRTLVHHRSDEVTLHLSSESAHSKHQ